MRAQRLQLLHGRIHGCGDFGVHIVRIAQSGRIGDPQATYAVFQTHGVVAGVRGQRCPVSGIGLLEHVGHQGGVAHAHGVRPQVRHRTKRRQGVGGHPSKAGFQAHVATKGRRNPHTACAIGAHTDGPQTCRHGCGRAT